MNDLSVGTIVFYVISGVTIVSAAGVAFSRNIVYSALALLGTFAGVVGLYAFLAADFVAVVQLLVYIGGILVITIFAVMLTHRIADVQVSNRSVARLPALLITGGVFLLMSRAVYRTSWHLVEAPAARETTYAIGNAFLGKYVLPFELASLVLLAALIGAIVLSRKELR
ncbi:MAG: NADH-quinone oxidoreductase subunit J family protein [Candidatus Binatia bacterium]